MTNEERFRLALRAHAAEHAAMAERGLGRAIVRRAGPTGVVTPSDLRFRRPIAVPQFRWASGFGAGDTSSSLANLPAWHRWAMILGGTALIGLGIWWVTDKLAA